MLHVMHDWSFVAIAFVTLCVFWRALNWSFDTISQARADLLRIERAEAESPDGEKVA